MAYDAVSGRLVIADESSDTLKIVSAASNGAVDLVSRGWAGAYRTTAIAIDGRRGDLWVVGMPIDEETMPDMAASFLSTIPPGDLPHLVEHVEQHVHPSDDIREFEFGLDLVLESLERRLADQTADGPSVTRARAAGTG